MSVEAGESVSIQVEEQFICRQRVRNLKYLKQMSVEAEENVIQVEEHWYKVIIYQHVVYAYAL